MALEARDFGQVMDLVKDDGQFKELRVWAKSLNSVPKAFQRWKAMTQTALDAKEETPLMIFMDQTELLTRDRARKSSTGGMHSCWTNLCSWLPHNMACFFVGTLDLMDQCPHYEYTTLVVHRVPALVPLSLAASKEMMKAWNGKQYGNAELQQMHFFSSGVPRLLEWAFQAQGELSTGQIGLNEMSRCFKDSYASAAPFFKEPEVGLSLLLCSAVRWPAGDTPGAQAPGTKKTWSEIFNAGAAFPATNNTVLVPRVWWSQDHEVREQLRQELKNFQIFLDELLPDPFELVKKPGDTNKGDIWERCVANALAARYRVHCMKKGLAPSATSPTWVPFLEIYPTEDQHLQTVLKPFEACWCDGVKYDRKEATVLDPASYAIKANTDSGGAHHDLLIPVRRIGTQQLEYIAAQCRYGNVKNAGELGQQNKARKGDKVEMNNVLLHICDKATNGKQDLTSPDWMKRQEKGKYALMNCKEIIAQPECLRIA